MLRLIGVDRDVDGDGKDALLWQNANGTISAWTSTGTGFAENSYAHGAPGAAGSSWHVVTTADFDGDGKDDILWREAGGAISIWRSTGTGFAEGSYYDASVGNDWHIVGTGDFSGEGRDDILNGDGREDLIWRNGSQTSIWEATSGGFDKNTFYDTSVPSSWHVASVEDLNGDGKADLVWRNDNGTLSTWLSNGQGFTEAVYNTVIATSWSVIGHDF